METSGMTNSRTLDFCPWDAQMHAYSVYKHSLVSLFFTLQISSSQEKVLPKPSKL
jgi:hypothetical protein